MIGLYLENSTGSSTSLAFAHKWLKICTADHERCGAQLFKANRLPTRLIELHKGGARLCAPDATQLQGVLKYATLSHCWGTLDILKLSKNNLDSFYQAIPMEALCKTFQDALVAARALELKFIWIDSLCIVQDDEDDWARESASMADVYGNALINIAATHAPDGSAGLFIDRSAAQSLKTVRPYQCK